MPVRSDTVLRVLIVDDNEDTADSLAVLVRMWGHEVQTTHDGLSAIETSLGFRPEVVVLDIGLPEIDGFEVAARLRALPGFERALIVGSSGYNSESDRRRAAEVGIDLYFVKPFDPWRLESILQSHRSKLYAIVA
jgi:two-component system CheB/CheR fusion protein